MDSRLRGNDGVVVREGTVWKGRESNLPPFRPLLLTCNRLKPKQAPMTSLLKLGDIIMNRQLGLNLTFVAPWFVLVSLLGVDDSGFGGI